MQAVILAAGVGSRLKTLSGGKPKCLLEIGGKPIILHQLEALADHGVGPVVCVLGYHADEVREVIGQRATIVINERYEDTNSLYSLWLARDSVTGPFVLLNCDLLFDPDILDRLLEETGCALAYDSTSSRGREQTKVAIRDRKVVDIGKDLPPGSAKGESLGLLKFDAEGGTAMLQMADHLMRDGHEKAWVMEATRAVCQIVPLVAVNIAGKPWTEIDFPHDLDVARREVWPAIHKGRWRQTVRWRRTRWAALAVLLVIFGVTGWLASTTVGPASVDWETAAQTGGTPVSIMKGDRTQRWWRVPLHERTTATVPGGPVTVEFRLVRPEGMGADSARYVVALTLDNRPLDWRALTSTHDSSTSLAGRAVGDRDRVQLNLPAGQHTLGVELVAAHAGDLLVRVRIPEIPHS